MVFGTAGVGSGTGTGSGSSGSLTLTGIFMSGFVKAGAAVGLGVAAVTGVLEIQWGTIFYIYKGNSGKSMQNYIVKESWFLQAVFISNT